MKIRFEKPEKHPEEQFLKTGPFPRSGPQSLDSAAAILRWILRFIILPKHQRDPVVDLA